MKLAVTSASGQLGSAIIRQLIQEVGKENIIGIARTPKKAEHLGIEIRQGDYNSQADFDKALEGVDRLILISGMDEPRKRIQQHRNVIEAAKNNKVEKIVYTSIIGNPERTAFSPVIQSNRQTELDIQNSGILWAIGRNGIYIEPDLDYLPTYISEGEIRNCAADGKCAYTSRSELGVAYSKMLLKDELHHEIYNLVGEGITQTTLAQKINEAYQTQLTFKNVSVDDYLKERSAALGEFLGPIIAGIYEGILNNSYDLESSFEKVVGRPHKSVSKMIQEYKQQQNIS